uniref:Large ribosomal subunit protein mL53 n=1 Tax=Tetraselmis sp. GSL018 TaxID=582737 RepID=A0A061RNS0_9CHLO|mmetsp:Transcript_194/g.382  ORF Transcript_194/g.382 Transcript_194/m.382 type:complete len:131 (+) Transcript_194:183-575(+)
MSLKQVSSIFARFNPLGKGTNSVKEFMSRCESAKAKASNPECVVTAKLSLRETEPTVTVVFLNGTKEVYQTSNMTAEQLSKAIQERREVLDAYELLEKNGVSREDKLMSDWGLSVRNMPKIWTTMEAQKD